MPETNLLIFMNSQRTQNTNGYTVLLGGLGGDSHSVGLTILRQALTLDGYTVRYLGTQNSLDEFFKLAPLCNAVMMSNLDGHTLYYLREFPELTKRYKTNGTLWYLGGNLHVGDSTGYQNHFREMGFHRVFVKFVDIKTVLETLARDLDGVAVTPYCPTLWEHSQVGHLRLPAAVSDHQVDLDSFERMRREVLGTWKTGHEVRRLEENAEFLAAQPSFPKIQARINGSNQPPLIQPRSGVPTLDAQIKLFNTFKSVGVPVLSYQVDSLTRNNNYALAEEAIRESLATGTATINGFPVVNHGVAGLRRVIREVRAPLQTRHSTRDPRLLAEISYAGGVTAFEGGAICYNIPYYKDYPLDESINNWHYVDRLTGLYHERFGIVLDREFFGTLTGTLIPPCLAITIDLVEAVLAVQQGVKCVSLGYAEQGNRHQDIAAIRVMRELGEDVIRNLGYKDVQVNTVFHQYMAAFPDDPVRAEELIYQSAITGALSGATRMLIKTSVEAYRIPTLADNLAALQLVRRGILKAAGEEINEAIVSEEAATIRREVQQLFEGVIMAGGGTITAGVVAAFKKGFLEVPFAPSVYNQGQVVTIRDVNGAVRFLSTGNLPFDRELREFHHQKADERRRCSGLRSHENDYLLVEEDVLQISRSRYERWPLAG